MDIFKFESTIVHENVVYVELARGEGVNGGDALVVGVQIFKPPPHMQGHGFRDFGVRINKYRFSMHVESLNIVGTSEVVESKLGSKIRYSFPKAVKALIKIRYSLNGISITVLVK